MRGILASRPQKHLNCCCHVHLHSCIGIRVFSSGLPGGQLCHCFTMASFDQLKHEAWRTSLCGSGWSHSGPSCQIPPFNSPPACTVLCHSVPWCLIDSAHFPEFLLRDLYTFVPFHLPCCLDMPHPGPLETLCFWKVPCPSDNQGKSLLMPHFPLLPWVTLAGS